MGHPSVVISRARMYEQFAELSGVLRFAQDDRKQACYNPYVFIGLDPLGSLPGLVFQLLNPSRTNS